MQGMADVVTTCQVCGATFDTKRGLNVHLTGSGHRQAHDTKMLSGPVEQPVGADMSAVRSRSVREVLATFATTARSVPCQFPGCSASFQSGHGLKIHQSMRGHQPPADNLSRGDGPEPVVRVRGPAKQPDTNLDQAETGTLAKEDHPTFLRLRKPETDPAPTKLADRILQLVRTADDEDEQQTA